MTEAQAFEVMKARWISAWVAEQPTVPYCFEGEIIDSADTWVRVTFRPTLRAQATLGPAGGRRFEDRGRIFVQLFTPIGAGEATMLSLAESVRNVFESRTIDVELRTYSATRRMAPDGQREGFEDGRWVMCTMSIPYWFDETR